MPQVLFDGVAHLSTNLRFEVFQVLNGSVKQLLVVGGHRRNPNDRVGGRTKNLCTKGGGWIVNKSDSLFRQSRSLNCSG